MLYEIFLAIAIPTGMAAMFITCFTAGCYFNDKRNEDNR